MKNSLTSCLLFGLAVFALTAGMPRARAQVCNVLVGEEVNLYHGSVITIRTARDVKNDQPAVLWFDKETNQVFYKLHSGPGDQDWGDAVLVEKGNIFISPAYDLRGYRMIDLAFDSAGEPHVFLVGTANEQSDDMKLFYTHQVGNAGWTEPEIIADMPDLTQYPHSEPFIFAEFDSLGRLHVVYYCYSVSGDVYALYREDCAWRAPVNVMSGAAGLDVAIGPDDRIHIVTIKGGGNQHQAYYKRSRTDGSWPSGNGTQITQENPIVCMAGPVACWPSVATDRTGKAHVAYGVDPDPCCEEALSDPTEDCVWGGEPDPEPTWIREGGHVSYMARQGANWTQPADIVLDGTALHGPYPFMLLDGTGMKYIIVTNRKKQFAYAPATQTFEGNVKNWRGGRSDWYHVDAVATGDGAWVAYRDGTNVNTKHLARTAGCGDEECEEGFGRACGLCGVQQCGADSHWGACTGEGPCYPETTEACGAAGTRTCECDCQWGPCLNDTDGGVPDGGQPDAGQPDAGQPDAGQPDAGQPDAGQPDAGQPDAGQPDAGQPDAGQPDAGQPDAGQPDAGQPDAGQPDAGQTDAGENGDPGTTGSDGCGCGRHGKQATPAWLVILFLMISLLVTNRGRES